jgi:hypothetical protein
MHNSPNDIGSTVRNWDLNQYTSNLFSKACSVEVYIYLNSCRHSSLGRSRRILIQSNAKLERERRSRSAIQNLRSRQCLQAMIPSKSLSIRVHKSTRETAIAKLCFSLRYCRQNWQRSLVIVSIYRNHTSPDFTHPGFAYQICHSIGDCRAKYQLGSYCHASGSLHAFADDIEIHQGAQSLKVRTT